MATSGNDTITGTSGNDTLEGLGGDDTIYGYAGADVLIGGAGNDLMFGGKDDDTYYVSQAGDRAIETDQGSSSSAYGSYDRVVASISFALGAFIERLDLVGDGDIDGKGNDLDNLITGNAGNNVINGGGGGDLMGGGLGDDIYIYDNAGDSAYESFENGGSDLIKSSVTATLNPRIERLRLVGDADIDGSGANGTYDEALVGNSGRNRLTGGLGDDQLYGGGGADTLDLTGPFGDFAGAERLFYLAAAESTGVGFDTIIGFDFADDKIDVTGIAMDGVAPTFQGDVIKGGSLSRDTFNQDLGAAVDNDLSAGEAVIFVADAGDFAGQTFLVIDFNGQAGYQAGGDLVMRLQDSTVPTNSDFLV